MTLSDIGQSAAIVVGLTFMVAGATKVVPRHTDLSKTALAMLMKEHLPNTQTTSIHNAWLAIGVFEFLLGAAFVSGATPAVVGAVGAAAMVAALGYLWLGYRLGQAATCGCVTAGTEIAPRTFLRSTWIGLLSLTYALGGQSFRASHTPWKTGVVLVLLEAASVVALSGELSPWARDKELQGARVWYLARGWLVSTGAVRLRIEQLAAWENLAENVADESGVGPVIVSAWRDGQWRMFEYQAHLQGRPVTIVAGQHLGVRPSWTRIVMLDEGEDGQGGVLASWDSAIAARHERASSGHPLRHEGLPAGGR